MDRDRLKQVQQTDLTESRVNRDLIDWLRERGPTYLLVVLVVLVAIVGFHKLRESRATAHSEAFFDLDGATEPESYKLVAEDHEGTASVAELARLYAGDHYFFAVQSLRDPDNPDGTPTEEQLNEWRAQAREMWEQVLAATENDPARALLRIQALFGLAAIAEGGGAPDFEKAKMYYERVVETARGSYPPLAAQAEARLATLEELRGLAELPNQADLPAKEFLNPLLEDIFVEHGLDDPT